MKLRPLKLNTIICLKLHACLNLKREQGFFGHPVEKK